MILQVGDEGLDDFSTTSSTLVTAIVCGKEHGATRLTHESLQFQGLFYTHLAFLRPATTELGLGVYKVDF